MYFEHHSLDNRKVAEYPQQVVCRNCHFGQLYCIGNTYCTSEGFWFVLLVLFGTFLIVALHSRKRIPQGLGQKM